MEITLRNYQDDANRLAIFYQNTLRPAMEIRSTHNEIAHIDQLFKTLSDSAKKLSKLQLGFLGESQVGKSSLINALLDRTALPSGGIGPLTAQAIRVRHGKDEEFHVSYHGPGRLHRLRFALESDAERSGLLTRDTQQPPPNAPPIPEEDDERHIADLDAAITDESQDSSTDENQNSSTDENQAIRRNPRLEAYAAQARRLLEQDESGTSTLPEVIGGLRRVLGMAPRFGAESRSSWEPRM